MHFIAALLARQIRIPDDRHLNYRLKVASMHDLFFHCDEQVSGEEAVKKWNLLKSCAREIYAYSFGAASGPERAGHAQLL